MCVECSPIHTPIPPIPSLHPSSYPRSGTPRNGSYIDMVNSLMKNVISHHLRSSAAAADVMRRTPPSAPPTLAHRIGVARWDSSNRAPHPHTHPAPNHPVVQPLLCASPLHTHHGPTSRKQVSAVSTAFPAIRGCARAGCAQQRVRSGPKTWAWPALPFPDRLVAWSPTKRSRRPPCLHSTNSHFSI